MKTWAPAITSPKEAREAMFRWLEWVSADEFTYIVHRSPKKRDEGRSNRRRVLQALGMIGLEQGSINVNAPLRQVAEWIDGDALSISTIDAHLTAEAKRKGYLRVARKGRSNSHGGFATVYKLHVDKPREEATT